MCRYLAADFQIECGNAQWYGYALWAAASAVLYIIGIPYLFVSLVKRQRLRHVRDYIFQVYGTGARKKSLYELQPHGCRRRCGAKISGCFRPLTRAINRNIIDPLLSEKPKDVSLQALYAGRSQELEALLDVEKKNLLAAALKDCSDRDIIPAKRELDTVREFLYRDNLESYHTKKQLGFMYHACVGLGLGDGPLQLVLVFLTLRTTVAALSLSIVFAISSLCVHVCVHVCVCVYVRPRGVWCACYGLL